MKFKPKKMFKNISTFQKGTLKEMNRYGKKKIKY